MKTNQIPGVTKQDAKIIAQVVELFSQEGDGASGTYQKLKLHLIRIFGQEITCDHYVMLGQVIGLKSATDNKEHKKINYFNYGSSRN